VMFSICADLDADKHYSLITAASEVWETAGFEDILCELSPFLSGTILSLPPPPRLPSIGCYSSASCSCHPNLNCIAERGFDLQTFGLRAEHGNHCATPLVYRILLGEPRTSAARADWTDSEMWTAPLDGRDVATLCRTMVRSAGCIKIRAPWERVLQRT
jgi:hypothetical protein